MTDWDKRFYAKVRRGFDFGCEEWQGATDEYGYGMFRVGPNKVRRAHRVAWELAYGAVPDGTVFLHSCDNPACVNIYHLSIGTRAENNADRDAKGRHWTHSGANHGMAKLTPEAVAEIRSYPPYSRVAHLAEKYGVAVGTIHQIRSANSRTWKEVSV